MLTLSRSLNAFRGISSSGLNRLENTIVMRSCIVCLTQEKLSFSYQKYPGMARSFSTNTSPKGPGQDEEDPKKELTPFQKLKHWMQPFVSGSKALYIENKQAWTIRRRLHDANGNTNVLTRQEILLLRQAHRDLLKSLPLLIFFGIPLVGYAAPLIGYQFPKQLLPWQFWRPDQKTLFFQEDANAKASFYPKVLRELLKMDSKSHDLARMLHENPEEQAMNPAELCELVDFFEQTANLEKLKRHHIQVLARSASVFPAFSSIVHLFPTSLLVDQLQKRMEALALDDVMLLKDNKKLLNELSLSELEFACEERGIVQGYGNIEALRKALGDWLDMYEVDPQTKMPTRTYPASLLLHAPALITPKKQLPA